MSQTGWLCPKGPRSEKRKKSKEQKGARPVPGPPLHPPGNSPSQPHGDTPEGARVGLGPHSHTWSCTSPFPAGPPHCPEPWSREPCWSTEGPSRVPSSLSPLPGRHNWSHHLRLRLKRRPKPLRAPVAPPPGHTHCPLPQPNPRTSQLWGRRLPCVAFDSSPVYRDVPPCHRSRDSPTRILRPGSTSVSLSLV